MGGLEQGWECFRAADWAAARQAFGAALAERPDDPDVLDALGQAIWWLGDRAQAIETRRQAYVGYQRLADARNAGRVATYLAGEERIDGRASTAAGWLARARRLLAGLDECPETGWLAVEESKSADDPRLAEQHARAALAVAHTIGDADIEAMALAHVGRALIRQGRVTDGVGFLDEAVLLALEGESDDPLACGDACCTALSACDDLADLRRPAEWCSSVVAFTERRHFTPLQSWCRAIYAGVLVRRGDWRRAEAVLDEALRTQVRTQNARALLLAALAELRLRQGRIDEAAALLDGPAGAAQLVRIAVARGERERAAALLERDRQRLSRWQALELDVAVGLAVGDLEAVAAAAAHLAADGRELGRDDLAATAAAAEGELALARSLLEQAAGAFGTAATAFAVLGYRHEEARCRLGLAQALARQGSPLAVDEARRARDVAESLGAAVEADRAAALLRELGVAGRTSGRVQRGELTSREVEVLRLVAAGLSNQDIAQRLVISPKTAEHHVGRILRKLGVRSRAEAAAHAVRDGI